MRVVWCVCLKRRVVGSESGGCFGVVLEGSIE